VSRWEIVNNWNIVFLSNIFYYLKGIFPHGISLSLILYMEPTTILYIFQAAIVLNSSSCDRYGTDIHLNPQ
jgi:hypothetical protein